MPMPSDTLQHLIERVQRDLLDSMNSVSDFRKDELDRLDVVRKDLDQVRADLNRVIDDLELMTKGYFDARAELSQVVRTGGEQEQREAYERAEGFMIEKVALTEREKGLRHMRDYLERDERRVAARVERSEALAGRFRLALNVLNDRIEDIGSAGSQDPRSLVTAYSLVERESRNLARELHDGPAQRFAGAMMSLDFSRRLLELGHVERVVAELGKVRSQMSETMDEIRSFLFSLYPRDVEDGLDVALGRMCDLLSQRHGVPVTIKSFGALRAVPEYLGANVYKVIRQAVANSLTKGSPSRITVILSVRSGFLFAKIMDDGVGFDVEKARVAAKERGSYGIVSMEERARLAGGTLNIDSVPGQGTIVSLQVPLRGDF